MNVRTPPGGAVHLLCGGSTGGGHVVIEHDSFYDEGRNGPRSSRQGPLAIVADVIAWHMHNGMPMLPAIDLVFDALIERLPAQRLYITVPRQWADLMGDPFELKPAQPAVPDTWDYPRQRGFISGGSVRVAAPVLRRGRPARAAETITPLEALILGRDNLKRSANYEEDLYNFSVEREGKGKGVLAILEHEALDIFGFNGRVLPKLMDWSEYEGPPDDAETADEPASGGESVAVPHKVAGKLIQPVGGSWPHVRGQTWTDAERDALFRMRHLRGMPDTELAEVAGVTSQRISQLIGSATRWKARRPGEKYLSDGDWQPTAALLAECGLHVQPLRAAG